jgi:Glyoxalase-like domain
LKESFMPNPVSRRLFLALAGAALVAPPITFGNEEVPTLLDHILLGCSELDRGIAFVEERAGVRAAFGGVHPGRGTRNALLSLGERRYLEVIAPDPKQDQDSVPPFAVQQLAVLKSLTSPRLIGWAAHPGDIEAFAKKLREAGVAFEGPRAGSRARPDGRVLHWKSLSLADDRHGLLPFFIEWSADSLHPSADAPAGCRLEHFAVSSPDPDELSKTFQRIRIDAPVERGEKAQFRAQIKGPKGNFEVSS